MTTIKYKVMVDMDDVQCGFTDAYNFAIGNKPEQKYPQAEMDFFRKLKPIEGSINAMNKLYNSTKYDLWILTRPSIHNPLCYTEKRLWVEDHLGIDFCKKLILSPDKNLINGDYLIDDQPWGDFPGEQILFGSEKFPTWLEVLNYLKP